MSAPPRRWRIAAACAAVSFLMLLWWYFHAPPHVATRATPADRQAGELIGSRTALPPALAASAVPAPGPASAALGADEIQICGLGVVKIPADGNVPTEEFKAQVTPARTRIVESLRSGSELARAAADVLDAMAHRDERAEAPAQQDADCKGADCDAEVRMHMASMESLSAKLARRAVSSNDADVYALAFASCEGQTGAACRMLSAEQWARLAPGNAVPWLYVLGEAKRSGDGAAQDEALHRIATARRSDTGMFRLTGTLLGAAQDARDDDLATLATWTLATEAIGYEAARGLPAYQSVLAACRGDALRDANRAQTCGAIAELMADRSDTLIERSIGVAIGKHLGWPADRLERMRGEYQAFAKDAAQESTFATRDFGCAGMRRELERLRRKGSTGEAQMLHEWVAKSGKKPEDFVKQERARQAADAAAMEKLRSEQAASAAGGTASVPR